MIDPEAKATANWLAAMLAITEVFVFGIAPIKRARVTRIWISAGVFDTVRRSREPLLTR